MNMSPHEVTFREGQTRVDQHAHVLFADGHLAKRGRPSVRIRMGAGRSNVLRSSRVIGLSGRRGTMMSLRNLLLNELLQAR